MSEIKKGDRDCACKREREKERERGSKWRRKMSNQQASSHKYKGISLIKKKCTQDAHV